MYFALEAGFVPTTIFLHLGLLDLKFVHNNPTILDFENWVSLDVVSTKKDLNVSDLFSTGTDISGTDLGSN